MSTDPTTRDGAAPSDPDPGSRIPDPESDSGFIGRIIDWSLTHRGLVLCGALLAVLGGLWSARETRLDAIPDLSDVQVIVWTEAPGQAPRIVEDQITYPITTRLLGVPHASVVRGYSFFGASFAYVLFEDGTDLYWARSRVLEALATLEGSLPQGVTPRLGPDATGVGWAFMYVLESDTVPLEEQRAWQDWYLEPGLSGVAGVAEIASIGGFVREYRIEVDPVELRAYGVALADIEHAVRRGNAEVGGGSIESGGRELMVRGLGFVRDARDLETLVLRAGSGGVPVLLRDVARVTIGPAARRGIAEWNGEGEAVAGIVVVRADADVRRTIERVRARLGELQRGLPEGVEIAIAYDRTGLIDRAVATLGRTLLEESIIVALVSLIFLLHVRSALVAIFSIPISILLAFVVMHLQGIGANIMSLGGIAISIGVLVDAAIVLVENVHKHAEERPRDGSGELLPDPGGRFHLAIVSRAAREVGPSLFFSLLLITVSFLPVFALEAQEGKLFRPLAFTKTWAMAASSVVAVTLIPVLAFWLVRGRIRSEDQNPVSRLLRRLYQPVLDLTLRARWVTLLVAGVLIASMAIPLSRIGTEFMPSLWEGDLLYMPTTNPGLSATSARDLLQRTDRLIASVPEVASVLGKSGRADTATDPAPLEMFETTIQLKDPSLWRPGMTREKLIRELDDLVAMPGLTNAWTMPIRTRIDMLSTGIRTPVGVKIAGPDLAELERLATAVEGLVAELPGTLSAYAERSTAGTYLEVEVDREAAARYGIAVAAVHDALSIGVGGRQVGEVVDGLRRFPIAVRYEHQLRDDPSRIGELLVDAPDGRQIPLSRLASVRVAPGPAMIKSENGAPNAWVYVDIETRDLGGWVARARAEVDRRLELPDGYSISWSGQYESLARARRRLLLVIPVALLLIVMLLQINTGSFAKTAIVLLAVPFSAVGAVWMMDLLGYQWSVAAWVGLIALAGLDAETGVVMLLYLDLAWQRARAKGRMAALSDLTAAVREGAVQRIRPKMMTVLTTLLGLTPILWATGTGADVMRRIAAPMVGGVVTSFVGELLVYPALYYVWRARGLARAEDGVLTG